MLGIQKSCTTRSLLNSLRALAAKAAKALLGHLLNNLVVPLLLALHHEPIDGVRRLFDATHGRSEVGRGTGTYCPW